MSTHADHLLNLQDGLLQITDSELYTGDGSVDLDGKPVLKSKTGNWKACFFILGTECFERLAITGIGSNLVTYLTRQMHQGNVSAARTVNTWSGTCYIAPLFGAFLADAYWGKYRTILVFSIIYAIEICILALSASIPALKPDECAGSICPSATFSQNAVFFVGLYLIAVGTSIKPCVPSFGADQFDDTDTRERAKKGSFFNWYFFAYIIGSLASLSLLVWVQENVGWGIGFWISALCMVVVVVCFFSVTPFYRFQSPGGSPITRICQVIAASMRKSKLDAPQDTSLLYETSDTGRRKLEHSKDLTFFDKAAITTDPEMKKGDFSDRWRLCTVTQVEELKILIRLVPILATGIVDNGAHNQRSTTFVEQGMMMERKVGTFTIPAASLNTCAMISGLIGVAIYEKAIIPLARKFTGKERGFSELQRMGIGLCFTILAMVFASLVETRRLQLAEELGLLNQNVAVPLSILWQVPQFFMMGIADTLTYVGRLEFVNDQSPDAMRSLCTAFALLLIALGSYLSSLVLTIMTIITTAGGKPGWIPDNLNEGHLDTYFLFWAAFAFLNLLAYVLSAMRYKPKELKTLM